MLTQKQLRLIIFTFIAVVCAVIIYLVATHGRLSISNLSDKTITLVGVKNNGELVPQKNIGNGAFITSGTYVVQNNQNGEQRVARAEVRGWLQTTTLTYEEQKPSNISRVAALTYEQLFKVDTSQYASYTDLDGSISGYTIHPNNDPFGGKYTDKPLSEPLHSPVTMRDGSVLGLTGDFGTVTKLNPATGAMTNLLTAEGEVPHDVLETPKLLRSSNTANDLVGYYKPEEKKLYALTSNGATKTYSDVPTSTQAHVFDVTESGWVSLTNKSLSTSEDTEAEEGGISFEAVVARGGSKKTISLGSAKTISQLALSPDSRSLAVLKDNRLWVFDIENNRAVFVNPFSSANQLFWNGSTLYVVSDTQGVSVYRQQSKQLLPLITTTGTRLSFSRVTPGQSELFVTAFSDATDSKLPDGYVIDLKTPSTGMTAELAHKLPYSSEDYDISYLGNTIYIRTNYYSPSKPLSEIAAETKRIEAQAKAKVAELIPADVLKKCQIVVVD